MLAPALFLPPDAVDIRTKKLMGRQAAGHGFLRACADGLKEAASLTLVHAGRDEQDAVAQQFRRAGWRGDFRHLPAEPGRWQRGDVELLHWPAPPPTAVAWQRARKGRASFAISGVTHTICSAPVMTQIAEYVTAPFAAWDALVCTSRSVLTAVERIWWAEREHLARRLGVDRVAPELPMTPVIPLGVHCDDFAADPVERAAGRAQWAMAPDELVVLFVGRLSLHAKANPWPMYLACAQAARRAGRAVRILECGWFANDAMRGSFRDAAQLAGIAVTQVDGREAGVTRRAYAAADIFVSLSDNIQETFGLTPVEAMAAGLPVVASDWDGYRETIRDGVDGYLIPTAQPAEAACMQGVCDAFADDRLNYDHYVARAHLLVSVDIEACTAALVRLIESDELRQRMGRAARLHAREKFDWRVVFGAYRSLWHEQAERRRFAAMQAESSWVRADRMNPLALFEHYPSHHLEADTLLWRVAPSGPATSPPGLDAVRALSLWSFAGDWLPGGSEMQRAWDLLPEAGASPGLTVVGWAARLGTPVPVALRMAVWLHKVGAIALQPAGRGAASGPLRAQSTGDRREDAASPP